MKITAESNAQTFKGKRVPKTIRKKAASRIISQIKHYIPEGAKMVQEKDELVLRSEHGKVLIKKTIKAIDKDPDAKEATHGVLVTTFKNGNDDVIKEIKNYYDNEGLFKTEILDADGTLIRSNEAKSFYLVSPSVKNNLKAKKAQIKESIGSFMSTLFNEKGRISERQQYIRSDNGKMRLHSIEKPGFDGNGKISFVQLLSPKRSQIHVLRPTREYDNLFSSNKNGGWVSYTK